MGTSFVSEITREGCEEAAEILARATGGKPWLGEGVARVYYGRDSWVEIGRPLALVAFGRFLSRSRRDAALDVLGLQTELVVRIADTVGPDPTCVRCKGEGIDWNRGDTGACNPGTCACVPEHSALHGQPVAPAPAG